MTVDLVPEWTIGDLRLTSYPFGVDADSTVDIGEPEMTVESVTSQLADGDIERVVRHGNRTYVLEVYVEGPTLSEVAGSEALLRSALRRQGLSLTHDPGDGFSPASVFEVQTAQLTPQRRDDHESHLIRKFTLTLTCAPFARSLDTTTVTALAPPPETPATVLITDAESLTGWTATVTTYSRATDFTSAAAPVVDAGDGISVSTTGTNLFLIYTPPTPIALTGTRYLTMEMTAVWGSAPTGFRAQVSSGVREFKVVSALFTGAGRVLYTIDVGNTTIHDVRWFWSSPDPFGNRPWLAAVFNISASNELPQVSARQLSSVIEVGGTERTPCSLKVIPGVAEPLGLTIVHTSPGQSGSPSLRRMRVSGNPVTPEVGTLSGSKEAITGTPVVAQMPISSLPEDGYALMAYMRSSAVGTFPLVWQARTIVGGAYLGGHEGVANAHFPVAGKWTLIPLAVVSLPPVRATTGGSVQFNLTRTVVDEEIYLDEWWPFRVGDDCALTIVEDDDASFLWLDSPDASSPVPRVWVSNNSDRSDQRHPGGNLIAQGAHILHPDGTSVFVATLGIESPAVSATYHKRWHSNAAE